MIITVKNLQQQTFTVNISPEQTVFALKQQIYEEHGCEYVVEKQKLIYAGIILDNERTIASYNVNEEKFVVVMLKRDLGGAGQKPDDGKSVETEEVKQEETGDKERFIEDESDKTNQGTVSITTTTADEDTKSVDSAGSGGSDNGNANVASGSGNDTDGSVALGPVESNTSLQSNTSGASLLSGSSFGSGSGSSETSHSTYSSGDLAGVFSNTSLQSRAESSWLTGEEYNQSVESMIEMGYSRESVERAMAASFNNPERAVEYLISGIPEANEEAFNGGAVAVPSESVENSDSASGDNTGGLISSANIEAGAVNSAASINSGVQFRSAVGNITSSAASSDTSSGTTSGTASGTASDTTSGTFTLNTNTTAATVNAREDPFEFLRNQPQFVQMRSLVYQNPELLQAVLQQIGQTNPALLRLISENQDAFLSMLNQPMPGQLNPQYPRRLTPGRRAQLAAYARAAAGGDDTHVRPFDTAPGAIGDDPPPRSQHIESGDAGANRAQQEQLNLQADNGAQRRADAADAFMRERAVAAAAVAALTAAASAAVERDAGGGGDAVQLPRIANEPIFSSMASGMPVNNITRTNASGSYVDGSGGGEEADDLDVAAGDSISDITTIRLTTQDRDAIERLKALGFPESLVLQAYFACEKDEQLTANLLISSAFDD